MGIQNPVKHFNPFVPNAHFLNPQKISEDCKVFSGFTKSFQLQGSGCTYATGVRVRLKTFFAGNAQYFLRPWKVA